MNEIYIIISGEGQVDVGDLRSTRVIAGDLMVIPADMSQRISNIGETDLVFYCICTPKFKAKYYRNEEENKTKTQ